MFNWSELHLFGVISYKIHILVRPVTTFLLNSDALIRSATQLCSYYLAEMLSQVALKYGFYKKSLQKDVLVMPLVSYLCACKSEARPVVEGEHDKSLNDHGLCIHSPLLLGKLP